MIRGLVFLILLLPVNAISQTCNQEFENLDVEKFMADIDTIKLEIDSTFYYINATYKILKKEVGMFGLKKTIQINRSVFLPFLIFICLYLLWLGGRNA